MRSALVARAAEPEDAEALLPLWTEGLRRAEPEEQLADLRAVLERVAGRDDDRIVVVDYDGTLAGVVYLRASTVSALNLEPVVQVLSPHVLPQFRRHGVGRALMDAAVTFAEERGIGCIGTAVAANRRDANRFMARLGLGPAATLRVAPTHVVRSKLALLTASPATRSAGRQLTQVLAARRSMRRSEHATELP